MKVKVWNKEIDDCQICRYHSNINGIDVCAQPQYFSKMFRLNERTFSNKNHHYIQEIPLDCAFSKSVTKEFIESFDFKETFNTDTTSYNVAERIIYKQIAFEDYVIQFKNSNLIEITMSNGNHFKGNIENQEHFKFIFNSLK